MSDEPRTTVSEVSVEKHAEIVQTDEERRVRLEEDVEIEGRVRPKKIPPDPYGPAPANVMVVAIAPTFATSMLYQSMASTTGQAFENAATSQQALAAANLTALAAAVARLYGTPTAETALGASKLIMQDTQALGAQRTWAKPRRKRGLKKERP